MDIEKLIEQLKWWAEECDRTNKGCQARRILQDAATALSTLQAENAQLLTELEQVKRERDAMLKDLHRIKSCAVCKHCDSLKTLIPQICKNCTHGSLWVWHGPEEG